jgi:hypothetical protein
VKNLSNVDNLPGGVSNTVKAAVGANAKVEKKKVAEKKTELAKIIKKLPSTIAASNDEANQEQPADLN